MKTPEEITEALSQCTGSEGYHFNSITKTVNMVYTDGVKTMIDLCQAHWVIDAIASHQRRVMKDEMLKYMQFWTLKINDGSAILICERDEGDVAITQKISFTDFPLPSIKVWLSPGTTMIDGQPKSMMVAMLPSEY